MFKKMILLLLVLTLTIPSLGNLPTAAANIGSGVSNLLANPGFEEGKVKWSFIGGSGIQTNNKYTGTKGFYLDSGAGNAIEQEVTAPFSGYYNTSAFIATGGANTTFGIKHASGQVIQEITLPTNSVYTTGAHNLPPVELKQGDVVIIYSKGGSAWTNGDDFTFEYDASKVGYNLLKDADFEKQPSQTVFVPRDGDYIFTARITATTGMSVTIGDTTESIAAGETKDISLTSADNDYGDSIVITVTGTGSVANAALLFDLSGILIDPPVAANAAITGMTHSSMALSGIYDYLDPEGRNEGTSSYRWLTSDTSDGEYTAIPQQDTKSLVLNDDMEGHYIKFEVTPVNNYGFTGTPIKSAAVGPVVINWVHNPGLEIEAYGSVKDWIVRNGASTQNSSVNAHNGFISGRLPANSPTAELAYPLAVEKTSSYNLGVWAKFLSGTGATELGVRLKGRNVSLKSVTINPTSDYQFYTIEGINLEKGSAVEIYVKGNTSTTAFLHADDLQLIADHDAQTPTFANLLSFSVNKQLATPEINETNKTITINVPYGTDITKLSVTANVSEGAVMTPVSGTLVDFTNPVQFTIVNGELSNTWTVTCIVNEKKIAIKSDNALLEDSFNWAVNKTQQFVMTGQSGLVNKDENRPNGDGTGLKEYLPSYWAGYYDRTAFYSRDFVHQAVGGQIVGLGEENYSMFNVFAKNATLSRNWYTLWAFNFDGTPHTIDYKSDTNFVREVPAQFELVEKAYKQYLWSGDERYINDEMFQFYTKTMTDFVSMHDTNGNGVAEGTGTSNIFSGSCTYNERGSEHPIESGDCIASQYQATLAYAGILKARGDNAAAATWIQKAADLQTYFNEDWSVKDGDVNGQYARGLAVSGEKYVGFGKENSWFMPMKLITNPGPRNYAYLDFISEKLANGIGTGPEVPNNIEAYTYIPDTYFPYNRNEEAWKWMKYIVNKKDEPHERVVQGTNGDYPEISFTFVSQTIEGIMGIEANAPEHSIITASHLVDEIGYAQVNYIQMGDHDINLRHDGLTKSTLTNTAANSLSWEVRFYGDHPEIWVDGTRIAAQHKNINGVQVSYAVVEVAPDATVTATTVAQSAIDISALNTAIINAETLHNGATEGSSPGQYALGSKAGLLAAIETAIGVRNNAIATQSEIDAAAVALAQAVEHFSKAIITSAGTGNGSGTGTGTDNGNGNAGGNTITSKPDPDEEKTVGSSPDEDSGSKPDGVNYRDIGGHWAEAQILTAMKQGIVKGFPDGSFRPNSQVTRAEFITMLMRSQSSRNEGLAEITFIDRAEISSWAMDGVAQAVKLGYINGYGDNTFGPKRFISRAEMAVILARVLKLDVNKEASTSFVDDRNIPIWARGAISAAAESGLLKGKSGGEMASNNKATRAEALVLILRSME